MAQMREIPPPQPQRPKATKRRSFPSLRAIGALILREMSTSYGRSPGGYIWALLDPLAGTMFLTVIFGIFLRAPPMGNSFALFFATGVITFTVFNDIQGKAAQALLYSKPLLAYPTVSFLDAILARFLLGFVTQLMICYLIFTASLMFFEGWVRLDMIAIAQGLFMAAVLGLGIGTLNCYILMKIPVWQQLWSVLMRPMFIISGTMFLFDGIPEPYRSWLWWNPLVHVIGLVRRGFYEGYDAEYVSLTYISLVSLVCFTLGLLFLRTNHRDMLANN